MITLNVFLDIHFSEEGYSIVNREMAQSMQRAGITALERR